MCSNKACCIDIKIKGNFKADHIDDEVDTAVTVSHQWYVWLVHRHSLTWYIIIIEHIFKKKWITAHQPYLYFLSVKFEDRKEGERVRLIRHVTLMVNLQIIWWEWLSPLVIDLFFLCIAFFSWHTLRKIQYNVFVAWWKPLKLNHGFLFPTLVLCCRRIFLWRCLCAAAQIIKMWPSFKEVCC